MKVSVVVPTWNEADNIEPCLASILSGGESGRSVSETGEAEGRVAEVIVADGGSRDSTVMLVEAMQDVRVRVIQSLPGRGEQLATGAELATGEMLLFLHADNRLPLNWWAQLREADWPAWGGFYQRIDHPAWRYRMLEWGNAWRGRVRSNLFGDQAIFVHRDLYERVGGFERVALMEDVMLSAKLRAHCPATLLPGPVQVDARRWQRRGVVRQTLLNWQIQREFSKGASPEDLRRVYDG
ncbi:Glycosyl transferase, family 2 [Rhodopirellula islandica]|uniref:Glycosyl transferase, family 2 n=1 Tax=Rhodopirellula islandica TaxID=595434 RepID=A0A0J1BDQ7_RHOIS|nr:TIGR04283 family arsenosugar biosynthesis glycosyltransferase [Rhodopirellula islandica]KLU04753.1 Glycosyl transferase, family 2 [Rhodopirellula islandica]